jgi:hypothetical protein
MTSIGEVGCLKSPMSISCDLWNGATTEDALKMLTSHSDFQVKMIERQNPELRAIPGRCRIVEIGIAEGMKEFEIYNYFFKPREWNELTTGLIAAPAPLQFAWKAALTSGNSSSEITPEELAWLRDCGIDWGSK